MTIQVEMTDGTRSKVVPKGLDLLLRQKLVKRFRRSAGWVVVGKDQTRHSNKDGEYNGQERRIAP